MASFNDWMYATCCADEPVSKKVERLEKELADLKARAAAEAEAKKPKTVGEAIAKSLSHYGSLDTSWYAVDPDRLNVSGSVTISKLAAAIDSAVEVAKAVQREKDARVVQGIADEHTQKFPLPSLYVMGCISGFARAADAIRNK